MSTLDRIAQLAAFDIPHKDIASATGLSPSRISQIVESDECQKLVSKYTAEQLERQQTVNDGWDTAEEEALVHVIQALSANPDPEFALRVALMANKAQRRGVFHNRALQSGHGGTTVIHLHARYVDKLQANFEVPAEKPALPAKTKHTSRLMPGQLTALFGRDDDGFDVTLDRLAFDG